MPSMGQFSRYLPGISWSQYLRDSSINSLGLLVSALTMLAGLPAVARLYSPEDVGRYGIYLAITSILVTFGAGKYETAIIIPHRLTEALETAGGAAVVSLVVFSLLTGVALLVGPETVSLSGLSRDMLLTVPGAVLLVSLTAILNNCLIREKLFGHLGMARILTSASTIVLMILLGWWGFSVWGLIAGYLLGYVVGLIAQSVVVFRYCRQDLAKMTWGGVRASLRRYSGYPKYAIVSDLANNVAARLPVLVFSAVYGVAVTGYLVMFERVWTGSSILGRGIGETFRQQAAHDLTTKGNFRQTFLGTLLLMGVIAVVLWCLLVLLGPWLFGWVLGERWRTTGVYGQILASLVCMQFVASPLGWTVYIVEKLRWNMAWQFSLLAVYAAVLYLGTRLWDAYSTLMLLSIAGSLMYAIYLWISYKLSVGEGQRRTWEPSHP